MARHGRTKSDVRPPALQMSPTKSKTQDPRSPASPPTGSQSSRHRSMSIMSPVAPSKTPEEWIEFALTKIWESGRPAPAIKFLAAYDPELLEFLMTANEDIWSTVHDSICGDSFPRTQAAWKDSLSSLLLQRFCLYLGRLPANLADRKVDETIRQAFAFVAVVGALEHITFDTPTETKDRNTQEEEDPFFTTKKSQKKRKNTTRARQNTVVVDPRLFAAINFDIPTSPDELAVTEIYLFERLDQLLKELLQFFRDPKLAGHARQLFFKQPLQYFPTKPSLSTDAELVSNTATNTSTPDPGAFPHIRPLGAAKYFDDGVGLGAWPVIVSGRAVTHLRQMQKGDSHVFAMVRKKITELSQGFFSNDNQKRLLGLETEVPIYEAKVSRDLRIVYQIDLDTDLEAKIDKQIIKLYGVYTHAQLDNRLWASVSQFYINRRGKEYRRRCLYRTTHRAPGQNVTAPAQFPHEEDLEMPLEAALAVSPSVEGMTEKEFLDLHSLIALEKFIPMSQTLINSILNDSDASHVFHVSAKEKEIIYHQSACFVLGRSGTGKTTSILFKMIGIEKLFEQMEEVTKPRQVFVTQSRVLAQRVQEYYRNLVSAASSTPSRGTEQAQDEEHVLADLDDEDASAFGLPSKYSKLEDKHFPLFLTYDQLCSLIEADFGLQFRRSARTKAHVAAEQRFAIQEVADVKINLDQEDNVEQPGGGETSLVDTKEDIAHAQRGAVTFEVFVAAYWPHFDYRLTKGFDPALVYSEFLGVIEGSEFALGAKNGALSREDYANMSHRKTSFASQRDRVYDLYEIYRKRKRELGGYDAAERTHALIGAMNGGVPGEKIDCLYVDEAQDNLLIDIKLLHTLSNNPHGIFMAGDTAQTISAGSSFRFEDLKAFMWRLEEKEEAVLCGKRNAIHPALFHLAVNYRSHGGIVDCASSVVQLVSELFPHSIDTLNKETGLIDGPKPVFFSGWDRGVVRFEQFLRGEADTRIDFGASQVILVRNDAARDALRAQVGEIGLILTLYESKGLEFDDVLLYNFFEDSVPSASVWRVVLHGLQGVSVGPAPRFDEIRHAVICTELKNLYVGLTRARNHCWIWEESEKGEPMKTFWTKKNLISLCGPDDPMPQLGVSSSDADWAKSGRLLFNKGLYPQAMFCFEKADLLLERDIAGAYEARKKARLLLAKSVDRQTRRTAFHNAAKDFLDCAILSKGKQQTSCYLRAAECYLQAEDWKSAAEAFLSANEFDRSAKNFRRAGHFAEAVDVVKKHRQGMTAGLADDIIGIARLEFLRKSQYRQATELFDDIEEQLEYMEDYGFDAARIHVLELHKRFADAAAVALSERNILECVRLLLCSHEGSLIRQAVVHGIHGLWTLLPYGATGPQINNPAISSLLQRLSTIDANLLDEHEQRQVEMFQALHSKNLERTVSLAKANAALARSSEALLCFAHCSGHLSTIRNSNISEFVAKSSLALSYFNGLVLLARNFQSTSLENQRLLGFEPIQPANNSDLEDVDQPAVSEFWVFSSSIMFEKAQAMSGAVEPTPFALGTSAVVVSEPDVCRLAPEAISFRLTSEVRNMHIAASAARYLRPCLDYAVFGKCNRADCGRHEVNSFMLSDEDRQANFNIRVRAHILQILIIHTYQAKTPAEERDHRGLKWAWFRNMYDTLTPHFPPLGAVLSVDPKRVPELNRGSDVISSWCERNLQELDPGYGVPSRFLSDVLASLELAYRVNRQTFSLYAPLLKSRRLVRGRPDLLLSLPGPNPGQGRSIVCDFIDFYIGTAESALNRVIFAIQHILFKPLMIEANVLVHLLESIGREFIVQARRWSPTGLLGVFDGLLLPQSWALDIVRRPPPSVQRELPLQVFINSLYKMLEYLRMYELGNSTLYGFNGALNILVRGIMITRVCRLLILVAINVSFNLAAKNEIRINIARSLTGAGSVHNVLCSRFARADSWNDLEAALNHSSLNRGADQLVLLVRNGQRPRNIHGVKLVFYENIKPELENSLSLTGLPDKQHGGNPLNPEAKSFVQTRPKPQTGAPGNFQSQGEPQNEANSKMLASDPTSNQATTDTFAGLIPSQVDYLASAPKAQAQRVLSPKDIAAGKQILFFYRRYTFRQRVKTWLAVRTIRSYYLRHRHRRRIVHTAADERVRMLHHEYKKDAKLINGPLLLAQASRRHEHILLGPMPHVVEYLRGLERINQRQKDSNKKRLQKVQHEELEKVQARMNVCSDLSKRFKRLGPKIQPGRPAGSVLHDMASLREKVKEVDSLRSAIIQAFDKTSISAALELHYELGVNAILAPSAKPAALQPPKPELNTSDLAEGFELY